MKLAKNIDFIVLILLFLTGLFWVLTVYKAFAFNLYLCYLCKPFLGLTYFILLCNKKTILQYTAHVYYVQV